MLFRGTGSNDGIFSGLAWCLSIQTVGQAAKAHSYAKYAI